MYLLGFETTGPVGSAALIDGTGQVFIKTTTESMSHLKEVGALAGELMRDRGIEAKSVQCVAASIGPGSFTGIRIGVTLARSFAQGLGIPCVAVPTLQLFKSKCGADRQAAVIFNARRGQVYGGVFDYGGREILEPGPYMLTDVLERARGQENIVFYGDGCDAYQKELEEFLKENPSCSIAEEEERYQTADMVCKVALQKYKDGETINYEKLLPEYMRLAEAEQRLKDGTLHQNARG